MSQNLVYGDRPSSQLLPLLRSENEDSARGRRWQRGRSMAVRVLSAGP